MRAFAGQSIVTIGLSAVLILSVAAALKAHHDHPAHITHQ
jgi:hypothetical protein